MWQAEALDIKLVRPQNNGKNGNTKCGKRMHVLDIKLIKSGHGATLGIGRPNVEPKCGKLTYWHHKIRA